jgi:ABC-type multidrug transport system ATPase subunit
VVVDDLQLVVRKRDFLRGGKLTEKTILESVSAKFPAGQVSVIMGPSGVRPFPSSSTSHSPRSPLNPLPTLSIADFLSRTQAGKSSLLQILAGRLQSGGLSHFRSSGSITLNGCEFTSSLASVVAFVQQASPPF